MARRQGSRKPANLTGRTQHEEGRRAGFCSDRSSGASELSRRAICASVLFPLGDTCCGCQDTDLIYHKDVSISLRIRRRAQGCFSVTGAYFMAWSSSWPQANVPNGTV